MRAIYVTKGSSLLPPSFASMFDDSASSVLDVFFDPSDGSLNLPGLTIGMFKFISKNMKSGGTKRYLGDLGKTVKTASSNALFAAITEVSDSVVKGAETNGLNGMVQAYIPPLSCQVHLFLKRIM
uniref:Senescence domain-containing protein n=1 Tax=Aegilops tauschii subsp. strangulata TaxID=200361 RepID=A0A453JT48_AEGTS